MRKQARKRFSPLTGERFGNVTAVELLRVEEIKGKQEEIYRCVCHACGKDNAEFTRFQLLHAGSRKSCGCGQVKMEAGLVVNNIEALMPSEGSRQWWCRCRICGELVWLSPPQFRMSFDREGCAECRNRARVKEKTQANKSPYKELKKHTEESRLPVLNSEREIESINSIKEKSRRRGKSYGQYVAGLNPVKVGKAPKGYTSWYERNGLK